MSVQQEKLSAIADAIRAKKGTSATIIANDFASEIAAIETGEPIEANELPSASATYYGKVYSVDGVLYKCITTTTPIAVGSVIASGASISVTADIAVSDITNYASRTLVLTGSVDLLGIDSSTHSTFTSELVSDWNGADSIAAGTYTTLAATTISGVYQSGNNYVVTTSGAETTLPMQLVNGYAWQELYTEQGGDNPLTAATTTALAALDVSDNDGKIAKYTGTTSGDYEQNSLWEIETVT